MLDINLIRERLEVIEENLKKRGNSENLRMLDEIIESDKKWRRLLTELNNLRHESKILTTEIAESKKEGREIDAKISEAKQIDKKITALEKKVRRSKERRDHYLMRIPNLL
ncbi:MAG: serine--tRNA ligase, partial [Candidatus Korarchaeota archaeon]|nr:serine--tRNA ligase [Candidatus Korarchaeota archaeon]